MSALIREALELALELAMDREAAIYDQLDVGDSERLSLAKAGVDLIRRALDEANVVPTRLNCRESHPSSGFCVKCRDGLCGQCLHTNPPPLSADAKLQQAMDVIDAYRAKKHAREQAERAGTRRCTDRED